MKIPDLPKNGFSANFIKGLPVPETPTDNYTVYENNLGLGIIVTSTGSKTFIRNYRFGKSTKKLTIGKFPAIDLHQARQITLESVEMLARGLDPAVQYRITKNKKISDAVLTFGDLADNFLASKTNVSELTLRDYKDCLYNYIFPSKKSPRKDGLKHSRSDYTDYSDYPVEDVTREDIKSILKSITNNGITRRANLTNGVLKLLFKHGVTECGVKFDPTIGITDPAKKTRGERYLDIHELPLFWNGVLKIRGSNTSLILRLILLLGRRVTEVCQAQWKEFDLVNGEWFIPAQRNQEGKMVSSGLKVHYSNQHLVSGLMVPLPKIAVELLRNHQKTQKTKLIHVFPSINSLRLPVTYNSINQALDANYLSMGLDSKIKPSDLRRTTKTHLSRLKIPSYIRDKITAHSVGTVIEKTYDKYDDLDEKREALEKWSSEIQKLLISHSPLDKDIFKD